MDIMSPKLLFSRNEEVLVSNAIPGPQNPSAHPIPNPFSPVMK
jgi:hypothetical protein